MDVEILRSFDDCSELLQKYFSLASKEACRTRERRRAQMFVG